MSVNSSVEVMAFSRQMRRRADQSQRQGRGFAPPGPGGPRQQRSRGGCCMILIIAIIASILFAIIQSNYQHKSQESRPKPAPKPKAEAPALFARSSSDVIKLKNLGPADYRRLAHGTGT